MTVSQYHPPSFISGLSEPKVVSLCLRSVCGSLLHRILKSFQTCVCGIHSFQFLQRVSNMSVHRGEISWDTNCLKQKLLYFSKRKWSHIFSDCSHPCWHPKSSCPLPWPKNHRLNPAYVNWNCHHFCTNTAFISITVIILLAIHLH